MSARIREFSGVFGRFYMRFRFFFEKVEELSGISGIFGGFRRGFRNGFFRRFSGFFGITSYPIWTVCFALSSASSQCRVVCFTVKPKTPTLTQSGQTTGESGTTKTLTCQTASTGVAFSYKFYKASTEVTTGVSGNALTLTSPTTSESGSYTCEAIATVSSAVSSRSTALTINFIGEFDNAMLWDDSHPLELY